MQSDIYKTGKFIIINEGKDDEMKILTWGTLLLYIDIIRLYKYGIYKESCLSYDDNLIFKWMSDTGNECNTQSPYSRLFGSRNAVPSHGIAFYVDGKAFDNFVIMKFGLDKINELVNDMDSKDEEFDNRRVKHDYYDSTYPVLIYSMKDFVTLFNFLLNVDSSSFNDNNTSSRIVDSIKRTIDNGYLNKRENI